MSQIEQIKDYFFLKVQEYLTEQFGAGTANELIFRFQQHFNKLFSSNEDLMPDFESKRHGLNPIFIMALYKAFEDDPPSLEILKQHVMKIYEKIMEPVIQPQVSTYENIPYPWTNFREATVRGTKETYGGEKFQAEILQTDDDVLAFDIHRCFYFELFQKNGMPELGPIQCSYDLVMANPLEKWIRFEREKTIADGDPTCTFRYYPK